MEDDNSQGWAYQQELEQQRFFHEFGCPDGKEIENYEDKHGV